MNPLKERGAFVADHFPVTGKFRNGPWKSQELIMARIDEKGSLIIESGTGTGKTPVEYAVAKAAEAAGRKRIFIITVNKTVVEQIHGEFPELKVVYGQNEHVCPWAAEDFEAEPAKWVTSDQLPILYEDPECPRADEIPHILHRKCPHFVDQESGKTNVPGVVACPYYQQKFEARQSGIVLCTMSYYLFDQLFVSDGTPPGCLVIDEVHRIADVIRNTLSYDITDWHLTQSIEMLARLEDETKEEVKVLKKFLAALRCIAKGRKRTAFTEHLLDEDEIRRLINILSGIEADALLKKIEKAVDRGVINPKKDRVALKKLETLVRDLRRYVHSFEYSLEEKDAEGQVKRPPLNYTCAYYREEREEGRRVQYKLVIRCHYVAPLIKKRLLSPLTVSFSATIGDPDVFGYETGIKHPFFAVGSNFPAEHARLYIPTDAPNLAQSRRKRQDMTRTLRKIAKAAVRFAKRGQRSLVVVISNAEREKFLMLAKEERLAALSYGNGVTAKEAAAAFRGGEGDVLVGTAANYSEGVDLPRQMAPVIFFLRPGYPNPTDASTQFEERRYGSMRWAIWNWRAGTSSARPQHSSSQRCGSYFLHVAAVPARALCRSA